jgi:hypothetical protein
MCNLHSNECPVHYYAVGLQTVPEAFERGAGSRGGQAESAQRVQIPALSKGYAQEDTKYMVLALFSAKYVYLSMRVKSTSRFDEIVHDSRYRVLKECGGRAGPQR